MVGPRRRLRLAAAVVAGIIGAESLTPECRAMAQGVTAENPFSLATGDNQQYLGPLFGDATLVLRAHLTDGQGNIIWSCAEGRLPFVFTPATRYFYAFHFSGGAARDTRSPSYMRDRLILDFFRTSEPCDGDGQLILPSMPALPFFVSMAGPGGQVLLGVAELRSGQTTELTLDNRYVLRPGDLTHPAFAPRNPQPSQSVRGAGPRLELSHADRQRIGEALRQLRVASQGDAEADAVNRALAAWERLEVGETASAILSYLHACSQNATCSDSLGRNLVDQLNRNRGWFEVFGFLATAGLLAEIRAATAAVTQAEGALIRLGREIQAIATRQAMTRQFGNAAREVHGGRIIGNFGRLTADEQRFIVELARRGRDINIIEPGPERRPDFEVNGIHTELKTLSRVQNTSPNGLSSALSSRLMDAHGQSSVVMVDARAQSGMTPEIARQGIIRALGAARALGKTFNKITIFFGDTEIVWPE